MQFILVRHSAQVLMALTIVSLCSVFYFTWRRSSDGFLWVTGFPEQIMGLSLSGLLLPAWYPQLINGCLSCPRGKWKRGSDHNSSADHPKNVLGKNKSGKLITLCVRVYDCDAVFKMHISLCFQIFNFYCWFHENSSALWNSNYQINSIHFPGGKKR